MLVCATVYGPPLQKFKTSREREKVKARELIGEPVLEDGVEEGPWKARFARDCPYSLVSQSPGQLTIDPAVN